MINEDKSIESIFYLSGIGTVYYSVFAPDLDLYIFLLNSLLNNRICDKTLIYNSNALHIRTVICFILKHLLFLQNKQRK